MTGTDAAMEIVVTETAYEGGDVERHFVTVRDRERDRHRLFFRERRRESDGDRHVDLDGQRSYWEQPLDDYRRTATWLPSEALPETRHASFEDFLTAIGYDWRRNRHRWPTQGAEPGSKRRNERIPERKTR
jgi:hypothetical protein